MRPGTVTVIGRGQVHVFEQAVGLSGAVVRFGGEMLFETSPAWLVGARGRADGRRAAVGAPTRSSGRSRRSRPSSRGPPDAHGIGLQRHLLSRAAAVDRALVRRRARRAARRERAYRRFADVLERDFARHHDAAHYADALAVPGGGAVARAERR